MKKEVEAATLYIDLMKKTLTASIYDESAWAIINSPTQEQSPRRISLQFFRNFFRDFLVKQLLKRSILLVKTKSFNILNRDEGRDWPLIGYTMVGHQRLENVQKCVEDILRNKVLGDLIEAGAWRGGTTIFMRALLKAYGVIDRKVWVADSFEGLPAPKNKDDGWDLSHVDYLKVSLDQVKSNFERFGLLDEQVEFLKGWFCDTLLHAPIKRIAILRLDGDMYSSTMDSLKNLYHKVSKGGYIIVDDYYSWPSCRSAVTDFRTEHSIKSEIKRIDWSGAYWKKE